VIRSVYRRIDRALFETDGAMRGAALLRVVLGPLIVLHLRPFLDDMRRGVYYAEHFHVPYLGWFPDLPEPVYYALLLGCVVAAALMTIGVLARAATLYAAVFVTYNFFLSQTHFHHNRTFLILILWGLVFLPAGGLRGEVRGPLWPVWWIRISHALTYLASGTSKLVDPDWLGGIVTLERVRAVESRMHARGVPEPIIELVTDPTFHVWAAKVIVATELFIGLGLWFARTRLAAIWVAIVFHVMIETTADVQIFTGLALACMLLWVTPELRAHTAVVNAARRGGRALAWCVRWLDWLSRFRVERIDDPARSAVEVDGERGAAGALRACSRLPALFFVAWPAYVVARILKRMRRDAGTSTG
jgi:hypothetical protein